MTVRGMLYLTAAALVTLLAVGTGIRELFLLCLFLWILGGLLLLSAFAALLRLRLAERLDRPAVIRGEEAMLHVEAAGFVACPVLLEWRVITPDGERHRCILTVLPGRRGRRYWLKFACPHRGPYTIGAEKVRVLDLLGLFSLPLLPASSRVPAPLPLLVYPVVEPAGNPAESAGGVQTAQEAADGVCDHGDTFADTRLYREGDSLGKIHWTQSLRTRTLYTRQYERQSPSPVWLLLDPVVPLGLDPAAYGDRLCDALASAAWRFVRQGRPVCLTLLGGAGDPVSADSEQTFGPLYDRLASLLFSQEALPDDASPAAAVPPVSRPDGGLEQVYAFTCRPDESLFAYLRELCPAGAVCLSPGETFPVSLEEAAERQGVRLIPLPDPSANPPAGQEGIV